MKTLAWISGVAVAGLIATAASAETVKIGVVLPFSGPNADLGHQIDKAFDLYIKLHAKDIAPNKVEIVKLNTDENPAVTGKLGITSIPTMHLYKDGEIVKTIVGAMPKPKLLRELEPFLG